MCLGRKEGEGWSFFKIRFNFPNIYELFSGSRVPSQALQGTLGWAILSLPEVTNTPAVII